MYRGQSLVDLPRIAVIGNQSAGKSSLIEAISGVRIVGFAILFRRSSVRLQQDHGPTRNWHLHTVRYFSTSASSLY